MRDRHLIHRSFSAERLQTYEAAAARMAGHTHAFELYEWNMHISCAFMLPLHTCEIALPTMNPSSVATWTRT
jgi:hypothetical protein